MLSYYITPKGIHDWRTWWIMSSHHWMVILWLPQLQKAFPHSFIGVTLLWISQRILQWMQPLILNHLHSFTLQQLNLLLQNPECCHWFHGCGHAGKYTEIAVQAWFKIHFGLINNFRYPDLKTHEGRKSSQGSLPVLPPVLWSSRVWKIVCWYFFMSPFFPFPLFTWYLCLCIWFAMGLSFKLNPNPPPHCIGLSWKASPERESVILLSLTEFVLHSICLQKKEDVWTEKEVSPLHTVV